MNSNTKKSASRPLFIDLLVVTLLILAGLGAYSYRVNGQLAEINAALDSVRRKAVVQEENVNTVIDLGSHLLELEQTQRQLMNTLSQVSPQEEFRISSDKLNQLQLQVAELSDRLDKQPAEKPVSASPPQAPKPEASQKQEDNQNETDEGQGPWTVHLIAVSNSAAADKIVAKAEAAGIAIRKRVVSVDDNPMHRLSIPDLRSYKDAKQLAAQAKEVLALSENPWIAKQ